MLFRSEDVPLSADDARLAGHPTAKALTIGADLSGDAAGVQALLPRAAQISDTMAPVGQRFAIAGRSVLDYVGPVEQVHKPVHMPEQVIGFHKACRGDSAKPLGNDSVGTNCPVTMKEQSTCAARCNSGNPPNGTFLCLAGKIRLKSVCQGQGVVMGDKVLFTLGVVASKCPPPGQLRTILANAMKVDRETVDGVFCEAGEKVPLSEDDARLAGHPTANMLTIGGEFNAPADDARDLLPRVAQLDDGTTPVGNRFATELSDALGYMGSIEQLHSPHHVPDQVIGLRETCHGDSAQPLGKASKGTNCPAIMSERSTCAADCNSGATANGTFVCLADRKSVV